MSLKQLKKLDAIEKYYQVNNINRRINYIRFSILNEKEREEFLKAEKEEIQKFENLYKVISTN